MRRALLATLGGAGLMAALLPARVAGAQQAPVTLSYRMGRGSAAGLEPAGVLETVAAEIDSARPAEGVVKGHSVLPAQPSSAPAPWWAPLASAALPGSGQYALKQQRSVAYLVAEAFLVVQYLAARRDGNGERDAYRSLAADVARKPFGGARPLGSWDYYENLEKFLESGAYDRVAGGAVDPEADPTTYNGARWLLARQTYWRDANVAPAAGSSEYQNALTFYMRSAVRDEYRWSWRDAQLQQDLYRQTISSANRSYQRAVNMLGVVAVNHLASLIDAYVSVRVRRFGGVGAGGFAVTNVETGYTPVPGDHRSGQWHAGFRIVPTNPR